jgi:V/A-type H+-transporting ATPase subunit E
METSLENLTQYIVSEAQSEADSIVANAREEADKAVAEAKARAGERLVREKESQKAMSDQRVHDAVRQKTAALRRARTQYAGELVEKLFDEAEEALCAMSGGDFLLFYKNALSSLPLSGAYTAKLGSKSAGSLSAEELAALNVTAAGYSVTVSGETIPGEGGFILDRPPTEMSFLFSDLLKELKSQESPGLIKRLLD